jgi:hypothetical protein
MDLSYILPNFWTGQGLVAADGPFLNFANFWTGQGLVAADGPFLNFATFFGQGKDWSLPMDLS